MLALIDKTTQVDDSQTAMMNAQTEQGNGLSIVRLEGDLSGVDVTVAAKALAEVTDQSDVRVIVDLSKTGAIDSTGLSELMNCVTKARLRQGEVILLSPSPFVAGVLSTTRLDTWFEIFDSIAEAKARLASS